MGTISRLREAILADIREDVSIGGMDDLSEEHEVLIEAWNDFVGDEVRQKYLGVSTITDEDIDLGFENVDEDGDDGF